MALLRIQTLGPSRIWRQGQLIADTTWPTVKSRMLFLLLITERGHPVPKDRILDNLWRNLPPKQAQNNLWVTISQLRKTLEPQLPPRAHSRYILTSPEAYTFDLESDYWLDVDAFLSQIQLAQSHQISQRIEALETARRLYRGDYLEELPYEEWVLSTRERLRIEFLSLLSNLADAYANQGQFHRAIALCLESLALDHTQESVYRLKMLYYYCIGERAAALKSYDECVRILRDELAVEPLEETIDLYHQIQRSAVDGVDQHRRYPQPKKTLSTAHPLSRTPFVGRDDALDRWAAHLGDLDSHRSSLALIEGEAGIGKSRFVQEALGLAFAQGRGTLLARCFQVEQAIAYQPILDMLRHLITDRPEIFRQLPTVWLAEIGTLIPEVAQVASNLPSVSFDVDGNRQARLFHALAQVFHRVSPEQGLVLALEDIHWADSSTLQFLHYLALRSTDQATALVFTYRGEEVQTNENFSTFLHSLERESRPFKIHLDRLSASDVHTLVDQLSRSSQHAPELGEWFYRETGGNPFFFVTILQSLIEQGLVTTDEQGEWDINLSSLYSKGIELTLPEALRDSLRERLRRVIKPTRSILELAAVLGNRFDLTTVLRVATQDVESVVNAIDELTNRQLLIEKQDQAYEFSHDKIREVVYSELTGARRVLLHRRVAEALEYQSRGNLDENAALLAYHFERAGLRDKAYEFWLRAGQHALKTYASQQAVEYYERSLALAKRKTDRVAALIGKGQAYFALDDINTSIANFNQALQLAQAADPRRAKVLYQLADAHFARFEIEACESYALAARQAAEALADWETLAQSLSLLGQVQSARGLVAVENEFIEQALVICRRAQNRWREGRTLADLGWLQAQLGEFARAIASATTAHQILEQTDDRAGVAFAWNILGRAHGGCGNYADAFVAFRRSEDIAQTIDHKFLVAQAPNMFAWLYQQLCNYKQAELLDEKGIEQARTWHKLPAEISAEINLALDWLHLGEPANALAYLHDIQSRIEQQAISFHTWRWRLRLLHAEGECHLALNHPLQALPLAEAGLRLAEATRSNKYLALNRYLRGAALADLGQLSQAIAEMEVALTFADKTSYQPVRWQARHQLASLYARLGQPGQSRARAEHAAQIVRSIGERLDDELMRATFLETDPMRSVLRSAPNSLSTV